MSKRSKPVEIVCIVDRSGSMDSIKDDAIGGFNQFLSDNMGDRGQVLMKNPYDDGKDVYLYTHWGAHALIDTVREAFRSGIGGANQEATLYTRPWRFRLQDITTEIHLWHGELDLSVPISVGRYVADAIPNCHATFFKDEAHISLPHNHIREILSVVAT